MQVPYRRSEKNRRHQAQDYHLTAAKFIELKEKLRYYREVKRPRESAEVQRLALMGDFSENAGYQLAKGRLRGLNNRILELENLLKRAEIIPEVRSGNEIALGSCFTLERAGRRRQYQLLGSVETDPDQGVISHHSPLGSALLGRKAGDKISLEINGRKIEYQIISLN